jgi:uncharacterized OB-fold protein
MTALGQVGTYLPPWADKSGRVAGPDEDVLTMAVAAGVAALAERSDEVHRVHRVVLVSRDLPLLEGGNGGPLLAGLGLPDGTAVVEQVGGAAAALDAVGTASPGTLVIGADLAPAGAAAALISDSGAEFSDGSRVTGSLPVHSRGADGVRRNYDDPRLEWERGNRPAVDRLGLIHKPVVAAGVAARYAKALCMGPPPALPTAGASSAIFALAALKDVGGGGLVLAVEQASAAAVHVESVPSIKRDEAPARELQHLRHNPGPEISISLAAYERAFEPKLRWEGGKCTRCGTVAFPPRYRCLDCGAENSWSLEPLPRSGEVYSCVTIHVPVPGLPTPYSLAIVQLDGVETRALVKVTGVPAGRIAIGDTGILVLRRVAIRSGIPDYGYAFLPTESAEEAE